MPKIDYESVYKLAGDLLVSQTAQMEMWKASDVCIDKLENLCLEIAASLALKIETRLK